MLAAARQTPALGLAIHGQVRILRFTLQHGRLHVGRRIGGPGVVKSDENVPRVLVALTVGSFAGGARQRHVGRRAVQHPQDAVDVLLLDAPQLGRQGGLRVLHPLEIQPDVAVRRAVGGRDDDLVERWGQGWRGVVGGRQVLAQGGHCCHAIGAALLLFPGDDDGGGVGTGGDGVDVLGLALVQAAVRGGWGWVLGCWDVGHGGVVGRGGINAGVGSVIDFC